MPVCGNKGRMVLNDVASHNYAIAAPLHEVVEELVDLLGSPLVATIGNVNETRAVAQWTLGRKPQRPHVLRFALQLALMIGGSDQRALVRAWFQGTNPGLGDCSPAMLLRNQPLEEIQRPLMAAARSFASRDGTSDHTPHP
jgi:hypothetical protein